MCDAGRMGTSTAGSESHAERLAKLQSRKKELEALLAAKNEELYKLCVQEVQLTGIMPPEAPMETTPTESSAPLPPDKREADTVFRKEPGDRRDRARHSHRQSSDKGKENSRKQQLGHRFSTPSISGMSVKSAPARRNDHPSSSCSALAQGHDERDTFSLHSSQTYPALPPPVASRHHTFTSEQVHKLYYTSQGPDTVSFSRVHETHFSSSQPDITTRSSHTSLVLSPTSPPPHTPLLYQYAEQLRARSAHLSGVRPRRNTLQRTQTYHLTGHSDHNPPQESMAALTLMPHSPPYHHPPPVSPLSQFHNYSHTSPVVSTPSIYSGQFPDVPDQKVKEKEWYESSLDSPSSSSAGINLSKESIQYQSPKKTLHRSPSVPQPPISQGESPPSPVNLPPPPPPPPPATVHIPDVAFESPKNITVVESGKWIPYREVSKPFEMSDFYKYSTKFRQNNNNNNPPKPRVVPNLIASPIAYQPEMKPDDMRYIQQ